MAFSAEDKQELTKLIQTAMDDGYERRRRKFAEERLEEEKNTNKETKVFLITLPNRLALPDDRGRAIFHDCVYARVEVNDKGRPNGFMETADVIAYGDGKFTDKVIRVTLSGMSSMVEIEAGFLESVR